jgi:hypothetical protein
LWAVIAITAKIDPFFCTWVGGHSPTQHAAGLIVPITLLADACIIAQWKWPSEPKWLTKVSPFRSHRLQLLSHLIRERDWGPLFFHHSIEMNSSAIAHLIHKRTIILKRNWQVSICLQHDSLPAVMEFLYSRILILGGSDSCPVFWFDYHWTYPLWSILTLFECIPKSRDPLIFISAKVINQPQFL